ncbi:MAG: DUF2461 domain-containing protein [Prevotella sp.]
MDMKELLAFLRDLSNNNNREWFAANKERYRAVQNTWNTFCTELIREIGKYDSDIERLTLGDCTYRIYRDTRFTKDKSPYKTHFGVFLAKGGKKSMHAGYYFHIGTGESESYPHAHMLAAGNYCYDPKAVKILREDISDGWDEFKEEVMGNVDPMFVPDMDGALKRVPREYSADAPYADWMRMKSYCLIASIGDDFVLQDNLAARVAEKMRQTKPFIDYINRAVDYVRETSNPS